MKNEPEHDKDSSNSLNTKSKRAYSLLEDVRNQMKKSQRFVLILSILLIFAVFLLVFSYVTTDTTAIEAENKMTENKAITELKAENKALLEKINALEQANSELNKIIYEIEGEVIEEEGLYEAIEGSDETVNIIKHTVSEGETLWEIAHNYLGDGNKYPKLAKENQLENPNLLRTGEILTINK